MMYHDEVIDEVRRIRDTYAAEHHHDLKEIVADLKKRQLTPFGKLVKRWNKGGEGMSGDTPGGQS